MLGEEMKRRCKSMMMAMMTDTNGFVCVDYCVVVLRSWRDGRSPPLLRPKETRFQAAPALLFDLLRDVIGNRMVADSFVLADYQYLVASSTTL